MMKYNIKNEFNKLIKRIEQMTSELVENKKENLSFDEFIRKYSNDSDKFIKSSKIKHKKSNFVGGEMIITDRDLFFDIKMSLYFELNEKYTSITKEILKVPYKVELNDEAEKALKGMMANKHLTFEIKENVK